MWGEVGQRVVDAAREARAFDGRPPGLGVTLTARPAAGRVRKGDLMGLDDFLDKAKDTLKEHGDQVKEGLDKAADFIKGKTDDAGDAKVDEAVSSAKEFIDKQK